MHGADHGDLINAFGRLGKQFRDVDSRLPVFLKGEWALQESSRVGKESLDVEARGRGFQMPLCEFGLWIKRVEMTCTTVHKQGDHRFSFG